MNPRAIALQGIGFGALLLAVQGFAAVEIAQPAAPTRTKVIAGGGADSQISLSEFLRKLKKPTPPASLNAELPQPVNLVLIRQAHEDELLALGIF